MQISYHSAPYKNSKITKLKKKKKAFFFWYQPVHSLLAGIARNQPVWPIQPVFKPVRNIGILIPVYVPIWYIPAGTVGIGAVLTTLVDIHFSLFIMNEKFPLHNHII